MNGQRYVDFENNQSDFDAAMLGSLGLSTRFICSKTGLRPSQVTYRLGQKHANIKRKDYRDGNSSVAKAIIKQAEHYNNIVERHIAKAEAKNNHK